MIRDAKRSSGLTENKDTVNNSAASTVRFLLTPLSSCFFCRQSESYKDAMAFSHSRNSRNSRMADSSSGTHLALALATAPWPSPRRRSRRQPCSSSKSLALSLSTGASTWRQEGDAELAARAGDEEEDGDVRKKIRLTKEQSAMLEIRFRLQSNLTSKQKQALAKKLNLQPRQVEVWFQNRRARKKLKQTEIDREFLKRRYEVLTKENQMLQKELQEMKALELAAISTELPVAGLSVCPTCGKISGGDAAASATPKQLV